ncbi:MAG: type I-E CRISPR-associated protein Cas5/CasD [Faecalibacterium sp.]
MQLLLLRLEGPMQSWGEHAKWDKSRDSALMPTKSGVLGLLGACMGLERGSTTLVTMAESLQMAVRADRSGILQWDFHTVQGFPHLTNAEGKKRSGGNTIVSSRAYLEDASFLVALSGDAALLTQCKDALSAPIWAPFLGRKSCPPSLPICEDFTDAYRSPLDALQQHPFAARHDKIMQVQIESIDGRYMRIDQLQESKNRHFTKRSVSTEVISCT